MKYIKNILKRLIHDEKKFLGRWNIEQCNTKINYKVDLSNEDHCGPCGQYNLEKNGQYNLEKQKNVSNNSIVKIK